MDEQIKYLNLSKSVGAFFSFLIIISFIFCASGYAMIFHVATSGNDQWSGKFPTPNEAGTDGPLASLEGARDKIRQLKQNGLLKGPVDVIVHGGVYNVNEPIVFEGQDSGTEQFPITYRAAAGSHPVFRGARTISGFKKYRGGLWSCSAVGVGKERDRFNELFANGVRLMRAKSPNTSYYYMQPVPKILGKSGVAKFKNFDTIYAAPADMAQLLKLNQQELHDIVVTIYHSWAVSKLRVAKIDASSNTIRLNGRSSWPIQWLGVKQRYILENYFAALDSPGEWFLSREGVLYYYPKAGEKIEGFSAEAPIGIENLLVFKGDLINNRLVTHITFKGLVFSYSECRLPEKGYVDMQGAVSIGATIVANGCRNIKFLDCEVSHTGNYGIWFRAGCRDCDVVHCYFHDLGAGGVKIGESGMRQKAVHRTEKITVENCIIRGGGRIYPGAVGIWIGQSGNNEILHNDISDFYYTGISIGWKWGYGKTNAENNKIEYNHIHEVGQKVLSDLGGIYTLGESPGTVISHNVIDNVYSYDLYGRGAWGIYNDQGSSNITVEDNLVFNTKSGGYHLNSGKDNTIRNNIFAFGEDFQLQNSAAESTLSFTFSKNIIIWNKGQLFYGKWKKANVRLFNNIYWDTSGKPINFSGLSFQEWQGMGRDKGSEIANPEFLDAAKFDFRLKKSSPALKLGFEPFDYSKAGVYGDNAWKELATQRGIFKQ